MLSDTSLARLAAVHPELANRIKRMDQLAPSLSIQVTQGVRSWADQDALYAQGRTAQGNIVTDCVGGDSWHNYGLAVDLVPEDITPGQPDWNTSHPAWGRLVSLGQSLGLVAGATWRTFPDNPHFQLTGRFPVNPDDEVKAIYQQAGMDQAWAAAQISDDVPEAT